MDCKTQDSNSPWFQPGAELSAIYLPFRSLSIYIYMLLYYLSGDNSKERKKNENLGNDINGNLQYIVVGNVSGDVIILSDEFNVVIKTFTHVVPKHQQSLEKKNGKNGIFVCLL